MALRDMANELTSIPKMSGIFAQTLANRALQKIYDESSWSFQMGESGWLAPNLIDAGTVTLTVGSDQVVGDATAAAAWLAISGLPLITQRQFRLSGYAIYNIIAFNGANTITLDRPWMEAVFGAGQDYEMYQVYYPAPVADFKRFITVRDFTNDANLDFWSWKAKQAYLADADPQRSIYQNPELVVPWGVDQRGVGTPNVSATVGRMLFELWPHQVTQLPLSLYFVRNGLLLVNPEDAAPYPLTDELVLWRAKELAYEWKASQKGEDSQRGSGADWLLLMQAAHLEYKDRLKDIKMRDRDLLDAFLTKVKRPGSVQGGPFYSAITGRATV